MDGEEEEEQQQQQQQQEKKEMEAEDGGITELHAEQLLMMQNDVGGSTKASSSISTTTTVSSSSFSPSTTISTAASDDDDDDGNNAKTRRRHDDHERRRIELRNRSGTTQVLVGQFTAGQGELDDRDQQSNKYWWDDDEHHDNNQDDGKEDNDEDQVLSSGGGKKRRITKKETSNRIPSTIGIAAGVAVPTRIRRGEHDWLASKGQPDRGHHETIELLTTTSSTITKREIQRDDDTNYTKNNAAVVALDQVVVAPSMKTNTTNRKQQQQQHSSIPTLSQVSCVHYVRTPIHKGAGNTIHNRLENVIQQQHQQQQRQSLDDGTSTRSISCHNRVISNDDHDQNDDHDDYFVDNINHHYRRNSLDHQRKRHHRHIYNNQEQRQQQQQQPFHHYQHPYIQTRWKNRLNGLWMDRVYTNTIIGANNTSTITHFSFQDVVNIPKQYISKTTTSCITTTRSNRIILPQQQDNLNNNNNHSNENSMMVNTTVRHRIDNDSDAEQHMMDHLDHKIRIAEEMELMKQLDEAIQLAESKEKRWKLIYQSNCILSNDDENITNSTYHRNSNSSHDNGPFQRLHHLRYHHHHGGTLYQWYQSKYYSSGVLSFEENIPQLYSRRLLSLLCSTRRERRNQQSSTPSLSSSVATTTTTNNQLMLPLSTELERHAISGIFLNWYEWDTLFHGTITNATNDPYKHTCLIKITGLDKSVIGCQEQVQQWVQYCQEQFLTFNIIVIDIEINSSIPFGGLVTKMLQSENLVVTILQEDSQLAKAIGVGSIPAGAILLAVSGNPCTTIVESNDLIRQQNGGRYNVQLGLHHGAHLKLLNVTNLKSLSLYPGPLDNIGLQSIIGLAIDLEVDSSITLGGSLSENRNSNQLTIRISKEDGQLAKAIGVGSISSGALVLSVAGKKCKTIDEFKTIVSEQNGQKYILQLRLDLGSQLIKLNGSCLKAIRLHRSETIFTNSMARSQAGNPVFIDLSCMDDDEDDLGEG